MVTNSHSEVRSFNIKKRLPQIVLGIGIILFLLVGLMLFAGRAALDDLTDAYPPPGQLIDIDGYQLHLYCVGEGSPTIIMEAGLNEFSLTWARVQPELAATTRVCAYDRAGFGWSDSSPHPRTLDRMTDELHTLLSTANIEAPYVIVAHSFGGIVSRLYAHQYPEDVAGIVLVDAAHDAMIIQKPDYFLPATDSLLSQFKNLETLQELGLLALAPDQIPAPDIPPVQAEQYQAILAGRPFFQNAIHETTHYADNLAYLAGLDTDLGNLPLVVISRGQPESLPGMDEADLQAYENDWAQWQTDLTTLSTDTVQIVAEQSGHYVQLSEPQLVIEAVQNLVLSLR